MSIFGFDHAYNKVSSLESYFNLGKRGFTLDEREVAHPGSTNRYIMMPINKQAISRQYLEYSLVVGAPPSSRVSLNTDKGLRGQFELNKNRLKNFGIEFLHRNYDWKSQDQTQLPGWNFLNFQKDIVPGVGVWITEYEKNGGNKEVDVLHPNTVLGVAGMVWAATGAQLSTFEILTASRRDSQILKLADGTQVWLTAPETTDTVKTSNFLAVVLRCRSLDTFIKIAKPEEITTLQGQKAAVIHQAANCWDIMIIE